jgi:hypothetical protein
MDVLVPNVTPFVENLPDTYLGFDPFLGGHAVNVTMRAIAGSSVRNAKFVYCLLAFHLLELHNIALAIYELPLL